MSCTSHHSHFLFCLLVAHGSNRALVEPAIILPLHRFFMDHLYPLATISFLFLFYLHALEFGTLLVHMFITSAAYSPSYWAPSHHSIAHGRMDCSLWFFAEDVQSQPGHQMLWVKTPPVFLACLVGDMALWWSLMWSWTSYGELGVGVVFAHFGAMECEEI
eukprot:Gb_41324 [translate_table: standard]